MKDKDLDKEEIEEDIELAEDTIANLRSINESKNINLNFQDVINKIRQKKRELEEKMGEEGIPDPVVEDIIKEFAAIKKMSYEESKESIINIAEKGTDSEKKDLVGVYRVYSDDDRDTEQIVDELHDSLTD